MKRQLQFKPRKSERPSGMKIGDLLRVIRVKKMRTGSDRDGQWWQPEIVTVKLVTK